MTVLMGGGASRETLRGPRGLEAWLTRSGEAEKIHVPDRAEL
eukprot:CAMPEP_0174701726 /NCGR_PEP_ID=MMETSP1094-20130205/6270_1 /TAXON_ID=156173 /ORGANISM="Chrysochromulina brevifilum, Strain UTEX LB 985" /LENGTH=41 /DNA_ID= /DNA_START= /DNA_END= /DNA_ORIENTATION=